VGRLEAVAEDDGSDEVRLLTFGSETKSIAAWARETGVSERAISYRLKQGCTVEDALRLGRRKPAGKTWLRVAFVDRVGARFGRLVVAKFEGLRKKDRNRMWRCVCDCGKEKVVAFRDLSRGNTTSCGCALKGRNAHNRLRPGESSFNQLFSSYKRAAAARGLQFALSREQFRTITRQPCFYCHAFPEARGPSTNGNSGVYLYSGIDRIDNDYGYLPHNVRACCKACNVAKAAMTEDEFFAWVGRVYARIWEVLEERGAFGARQTRRLRRRSA
jgi:hypothetical protein